MTSYPTASAPSRSVSIRKFKGSGELNYLFESDEQTWRINPELVVSDPELSPPVDMEVRRLFARLSRLSANQLVEYVYERHPEFRNSERAKILPGPRPMSTFIQRAMRESR